MWLTLKCDTSCVICHLGSLRKEMAAVEPTLAQIESFVKRSKVPFVTLSGGEPTCRQDFDEIIRIFKKHRKAVTMHTNGFKITDMAYLARLKDSGLDRVNLQFDGFNREAYKVFRGARCFGYETVCFGKLENA